MLAATWNPIALATICSSHIRTQRPQRMQSSCSWRKRCWRTSWAEARSWITFDCGHEASISSMTILRAFRTRSDAVRTFIPPRRVGAGRDELRVVAVADLDDADPAGSVG